MNDRHSLTPPLLALLVSVTGAARAAEPPATTAPALAPAPGTTTAPGATPAPDATPAPAPAAAAAGDAADAAEPTRAPDSDASPAVAAPAAAPSVIFRARHGRAPSAAAEPDTNDIDDGALGSHQEHWLLGIGLRQSFVTHPGFDLFSGNNALPQFSLNAGRTLFASGPVSLAAVLGWDWGAVEDTARGAATTLTVNRVTLGAEGRYHVWRRFYAFGRVAPGALHSDATIQDRVAAVDSMRSDWVFATDLSLGAAFEFAGDNRGASTHPRGWLGAEGGYGWAAASKLTFKPDVDPKNPASAGPVRLEPLNLGELAVRGAFFKLTATLTY